jgi:hypothetical protein
VYSASRGWPDCSRLSRIRVKGEDASLWLRSLDIKRMLCVRRCWIVDGAMVDGVWCGLRVVVASAEALLYYFFALMERDWWPALVLLMRALMNVYEDE